MHQADSWLRSACKNGPCPSTAEDIVQDVSMKLWSMCSSLQAPIGPLASVITRNLCISVVRKQASEASLAAFGYEDDGPNEMLERMMDIIDDLPDMQQTILRLRHIEGLETRQIADILGTSDAAIRMALSRARTMVREKLKTTREE